MSEWKTYKLGEVCRYCTNRIKILDNYISTENMLPDKGGICESTNVPSGNAVEYKIGDVLISNIRPYFKKIWHANCDGSCSPDILCIRSESMINDTYLYYLLSQQIFFDYVMLGAKGCKMPRGDKDHIMKWELMLPPIKIQEQIAEILSSLDDKIDLLQRENDTLEALAESLFRECFIEKESEEWKEGKLIDEFTLIMGQSPLGSTYNEEGIGTPLYQGNADFGFRFPTNRVFTTEPKRFAEKYDTLISVRAPVGAQNMAIEKCCIGRGVAAIRYTKDNSFYSYTYYKLRSLMNDIQQYNDNGTVFGSITKSDFESLDVILPDFQTICNFQNQVEHIDEKIYLNYQEIQTLTNTRDILISKLFSNN